MLGLRERDESQGIPRTKLVAAWSRGARLLRGQIGVKQFEYGRDGEVVLGN